MLLYTKVTPELNLFVSFPLKKEEKNISGIRLRDIWPWKETWILEKNILFLFLSSNL